jgi:hypothetical protein
MKSKKVENCNQKFNLINFFKMNKRSISMRIVVIATCLAATVMFAVSCGDDDDTDAAKAPAAVGDFTATAGNAQVALSWQAPADDGGSAITGYEVTRDNWATKETKTASQLSHTFTGLTNGTAYTFKVRAVNAKGAGAESSQTATPVAAEEGVAISGVSDLLLPAGYAWVFSMEIYSNGFIFHEDLSVQTIMMDNNWRVTGTQNYRIEDGNRVVRYAGTVTIKESFVRISSDRNTLYIRDVGEQESLAYQKANVGL